MKLSEAQRRVLEGQRSGDQRTWNALVRRNLVAWTRTDIDDRTSHFQWEITDAGRAALGMEVGGRE